jgi:hypothetical protein
MGVGIWASYDLNITGGDVEVYSIAPYSSFSYGIYSTENINISGGNIQIKQENAFEIGIGLIASEKINITGGNVDVYGLDDAINVRCYEQSGGNISAKALDFFGDGACRLVTKASILIKSFSWKDWISLFISHTFASTMPVLSCNFRERYVLPLRDFILCLDLQR